MKIIITGATGFVGSEVLRQAFKRPEITSVIVLSRKGLGVSGFTAERDQTKSL